MAEKMIYKQTCYFAGDHPEILLREECIKLSSEDAGDLMKFHIKEALKEDRKIQAIKYFRAITDTSLIDAKFAIDLLFEVYKEAQGEK